VVCGTLLWVPTQFLARPDSPVSWLTPLQPNPSVKPTSHSVKLVRHTRVKLHPRPHNVTVQVPTSVLSVSTELVSLPVSLVSHVPLVPYAVSVHHALLDNVNH